MMETTEMVPVPTEKEVFLPFFSLTGAEASITDEELTQLARVIDAASAANTRRVYGERWRSFLAWSDRKGLCPLPASPQTVARHLVELADDGCSLSTVRVTAAAIACAHRLREEKSPTRAELVRETLRGLARNIGRPQRQAQALTLDALETIRSTALAPRTARGNVPETPAQARRRGLVDVALCGLLSDGGLRRSEAAALAWKDIERWPDGSGRVTITRSKTDVAGEGAMVAITTRTMQDLEAIRNGVAPDDPVFGFGPRTVANRVKAAARAAGLGEGFSGHSGRVGMARRMSGRGASTHSIMKQGRWKNPSMVTSYTRGESAGEALPFLAD